MKALYLNPLTYFGFKKLFGVEARKPLLLYFLNSLQVLEYPITGLQFCNTAQLGIDSNARRAIYDIYCQETAKGNIS